MILKYSEQAKEGAKPEERVVPEGIIEELKIDTFDGYATYKFTDSNTTKRFAARQEKLGLKAKYDARTQKAVILYPGMTSEAIFKTLGERLQAQGMEVKWKKE